MFKYFFRRIKDFFLTHKKFARYSSVVILLVVLFGLFGVVRPAFADISDDIADIFANFFLMIAGFLGQILVVIIGILLDIISYNNFMDAPAVNTGWTVVRDVCNLFFVLILLVIGFGSVLRLENFKYNQLLGKLVIMIVLVNFSRMIAGFFIDISQVVLLTFANAFAATAAANFTDALKLREMLGFVQLEGTSGAATGGLTAMEKIGVSLLPVILLIVAIFTMIAMVGVFLIRILMLWILVVLSPLAYLLSVLPSSQQYSKQWWSNFVKWVTTGPILAFFIWFGLTLIAGGGISNINLATENSVVGVVQKTGTSNLAVGVSQVSSSESLLQFAMAIGMFIVSLITAQSLGGMAASFSGKMLGKLQGMGAGALKMAGAPLRGAGELAKMGGRKIRRTYRDSTLGKYTNVGAMIAGAKQRGEEVEQASKGISTGRGRDTWDKRPAWMGGGQDVVSAEMMARKRYQRTAASGMNSMQKEQKGNYLERLSKGNNSPQAFLDRQGMMLALAGDSHLDDAQQMEHFQFDQEWNDEFGQKFNGFAAAAVTNEEVRKNHGEELEKNKGEMTAKYRKDMGYSDDHKLDKEEEEMIEADALQKIKNNLMFNPKGKDGRYDKSKRVIRHNAETEAYFKKAMVSRNFSARPEDIDETGASVLYDIEELVKKNKHYEGAGDAEYSKRHGRLAVTNMARKKRIFTGEYGKQNERGVGGSHPHNSSEQIMAQDGSSRTMRIIDRDLESVEHIGSQALVSYGNNKADDFNRFALKRHTDYLGDFDEKDGTMEIYDDDIFNEHLKKLYHHAPAFVKSLEEKVDVRGYKKRKKVNGEYVKDENGEYEMETFADLGEYAATMAERGEGGWQPDEKSDLALRSDSLKTAEEVIAAKDLDAARAVIASKAKKGSGSKTESVPETEEIKEKRKELEEMKKEEGILRRGSLDRKISPEQSKQKAEQANVLTEKIKEKEKEITKIEKMERTTSSTAEEDKGESTTDSEKEAAEDAEEGKRESTRSRARKIDETMDREERAQVERHIDDADNNAGRMADSLRDAKVSLDERSVKQFSDAVKDAMAEVSLTPGGLEPQVFGDKIEVVVQKLKDASAKMPEAGKNAVMDQINSITQASRSTATEDQRVQLKIIGVLDKIQRILEKK